MECTEFSEEWGKKDATSRHLGCILWVIQARKWFLVVSERGHTTRLSLGLSNSVREHSTWWTSTPFRPQRIHVSWDASCSQMFPNKSFSTVPVKTLCSVSDAWKMNTRYWKDYDNQWKLYTEENNYWCLHAKYIITMSKTFWGGNKRGKSKLFCGRQEPTGSRSEQMMMDRLRLVGES